MIREAFTPAEETPVLVVSPLNGLMLADVRDLRGGLCGVAFEPGVLDPGL